MNLTAIINRFTGGRNRSLMSVIGTQAAEELSLRRDVEVAQNAHATLCEQVHQVINLNADGVNQSALKVRRTTDLLFSLGISDPFATKAGTLAQAALELANAGRGFDMDGDKHDSTPEERMNAVSKAIALVVRAEMLLAASKRRNRKNIDKALLEAGRLSATRMAPISINHFQ